MMLQVFITNLNENCQQIEKLQNSHGSEAVSIPVSATNTPSPPAFLAWQEKSPYLETLVDSTAQVAQSCIKCALIVDRAKQEELDSISFEIISYAEIVRDTFWKFVATVKPDSLLQKSASKLVKSLLVHTRDFMTAVLSKNIQKSTTGAEMVRLVSVEFKKLPKTHKAVTRRFIMGKCIQVKDTAKEFAEYVAESEKALMNAHHSDTNTDSTAEKATDRPISQCVASADSDEDKGGDDDDFDDDDFDDEEVRYTTEELPVVHNSISLFQISLEVLKCALTILTVVCDGVNGIPNSSSNIVPAELQTATTTATATATDVPALMKADMGTLDLCDAWVVAIVDYSDKIERSITDLGAELYPPDLADNRDVLMRHSLDIHSALIQLIATLQDATFVPFQTEDSSGIVAELTSKVTAYQWCDFQ